MYTPGTIANSQTQRVPNKINKNGIVAKAYKKVIGTRDTIRHLKTVRVISNEIPVLLLILSRCYFSCLKVWGGAGEGCKLPIIYSALLDYSVLFLIVVCYILVCKLSG